MSGLVSRISFGGTAWVISGGQTVVGRLVEEGTVASNPGLGRPSNRFATAHQVRRAAPWRPEASFIPEPG